MNDRRRIKDALELHEYIVSFFRKAKDIKRVVKLDQITRIYFNGFFKDMSPSSALKYIPSWKSKGSRRLAGPIFSEMKEKHLLVEVRQGGRILYKSNADAMPLLADATIIINPGLKSLYFKFDYEGMFATPSMKKYLQKQLSRTDDLNILRDLLLPLMQPGELVQAVEKELKK